MAYGFNDDKSKAPFGYGETLTRQTGETDDSFAIRMFQRLAQIYKSGGIIDYVETIGFSDVHRFYHVVTVEETSGGDVEEIYINYHGNMFGTGTNALLADITSHYVINNNTESVYTRQARVKISGTGESTPTADNYVISFPPEEGYQKPTDTIVIHWHNV